MSREAAVKSAIKCICRANVCNDTYGVQVFQLSRFYRPVINHTLAITLFLINNSHEQTLVVR